MLGHRDDNSPLELLQMLNTTLPCLPLLLAILLAAAFAPPHPALPMPILTGNYRLKDAKPPRHHRVTQDGYLGLRGRHTHKRDSRFAGPRLGLF
jgi:hypothetical protein